MKAWVAIITLAFGIVLAPAQSTNVIQTPHFYFAHSTGGNSNDFAFDLALDSAGNTYVTGIFYEDIAFPTTNLTSYGAGDVFLAKYDRTGNFLWVRQAGSTNAISGGSSGDVGYGVAVDGSNNVFLTGYFSGTIDFGDGTTLTSAGRNEIYLAKYDANGTLLWAQRAGGAYHDTGLKMRTDGSGNVYLGGFFRVTSTFGTNTLNAHPSSASNLRGDMFLAKYDPDGNNLFAISGGGAGDDVSYDLDLDADGNIYVSGYFQSNAVFGATNLVTVGSNDAFVAKYSSDGSLAWIRQAAGTGTDIARAITVDDEGNSFVAGNFQNTISFGAINLTNAGSDDIFIAKYDTTGNVIWATRAGGNGSDVATDFKRDRLGNLYLTGQFSGTAAFGPFHSTADDTDLFVACLGANGDFLWVRSAGGAGYDAANGLAVDSENRLQIAGRIGGVAAFDSLSRTNVAGDDLFFAKLGETPRLFVSRSGNNAIVSWLEVMGDFKLQFASDLNAPAWVDFSPASAPSNGANSVTNPMLGNEFFRLKSDP